MIVTPNAVLVRPEQVHARSRAETHALAFLARYRVPQTRASYGLSLRQWFRWCDDNGIDPLEATRAQIEIFARELEATRAQARHRRQQAQRAGGVLSVCRDRRVLDRDPMLDVRRPRVDRISTTQGLTRTEFADVLRIVESRPARDHALICLLGLNGLRVSETCFLDIDPLGHYRGQRTGAAHPQWRQGPDHPHVPSDRLGGRRRHR